MSVVVTNDIVYVSSGVVSSGLAAKLNGEIDVLNGGTLIDSFAEQGWIVVSNGGTIQNASATEGGDIFVNGAASELTAKDGGMFDIDSGGTLDTGLVKSDGMGAIYAGAAADKVTIEDGGKFLNYGGTVRDTVVSGGGSFTVQFETAYTSGTNVLDGGIMRLVSAGNATDTTVNGGFLEVDSGTAAGTVVSAGSMRVNMSNTVEGVTLLDGKLELNEATANATVVTGGTVLVYSSGSISGTTMNNGFIELFSGTADGTVITGGTMRVNDENVITDTTLNDGELIVSAASANMTVMNGGSMEVISGGTIFGTTVNAGQLTMDRGTIADTAILGGSASFTGVALTNIEIGTGATFTMDSESSLGGFADFAAGSVILIDGTIAFDTALASADTAQINGLSVVTTGENTVYTLTDAAGVMGTYLLASDAAGFNSGITFGEYTLKVGEDVPVGDLFYSLRITGSNALALTISDTPPPPPPTGEPAKSDVNGNGISDVMFQLVKGDYGFGQIGFWLDGTQTWQSEMAVHPMDTWKVLGAYDMNANGKADTVLVGNIVLPVGEIDLPMYAIGYYADSIDTDANWQNISYLGNPGLNVWENEVGNLTGNAGMNSIVWHSTDLGVLGVWTDGTDNWISLGIGYKSDWEMVGCGDFDGDGRDSVLMSFLGAAYYTVDIDSTGTEGVADLLTSSDANWTVRAIGDFSGDGKDDVIAYNAAASLVAMWGDGDAVNQWSLLGMLDSDWFIVGTGDYNNDKKDDLLVRQYSTGLLGYYSTGDFSQWVELGYGVSTDWNVIA